MSQQENVFEVGGNEDHPTIIIRRLPSKVPIYVDKILSVLSRYSCLDGPNNLVTYVVKADSLVTAKKQLEAMSWVQVPSSEELP